MNSSLFDVQIGIPLSKFTQVITNTLTASPELSGVWITAELSDVRLAGGHCYMELIEKNEEGQTIAKLRATIWRSSYFQLRQKFFNATQREISNGIKVLVRGSANHHSLYGLSFNISDIDPSYTVGDMERLRREILLKLRKEGILENNKRLEMPAAPQKIAVISAEGAAGYGDFINHLEGNTEKFVFYPFLFPCLMQGDKVSESIRRALSFIEATIDFWDCVVIVRGGGATTDLNDFDDYALAKAVATFPLPIVVGIGHERDRNVLDEIAHTSVKTPTAVAAFFIDRLRDSYEKAINLSESIRVQAVEHLRGEERRISNILGILPQLALRRLEDAKAKLQTISERLPLVKETRIGRERLKLDNLIKNIPVYYNNSISKAHQKLNNFETLLKVLDPMNTLKRGYSITRLNGKAVKSIGDVKKDDELTTTLPDGEIKSIV